MQSLNALIAPEQGWDINAPQAINDAGQIAATATRNGVQYAVRLDLIRPLLERVPQPEPEEETAPDVNDPAQAQAAAAAEERETVYPVR